MSSISRSQYQKLAEENKRLLSDLKIVCMGDSFESIQKRQEWRKRFNGKQALLDGIKEVLTGYEKIQGKPILHLNLKGKWFDMIEGGYKKEEYRDINDYWNRIIKSYTVKIKGSFYYPDEFIICFSNGYRKNRRQFYIECTGLAVGYGYPNWGAIDFKKYYILKLGKILLKLNCEPNEA